MNPAIIRPRLLDLLSTSLPSIVAVAAGAGAGKTTVLNQLVHHIGPDRAVLVRCPSGALRPGDLRSAIEQAVGIGPEESVCQPGGLSSWLIERYAGQLTLCLDDVQTGQLTSAGDTPVLDELIEHAEHIGRLILTGRTRIPGLARRRSAGQVLDLDAEILRFTSEENLAVSGSASGAYEGWPALEDLAVSAGPEAVREYLCEEVVVSMTKSQRAMLAVVASGCRQFDVLSAAVGGGVTLGEFQGLSAIPLVMLEGDSELCVHPIWSQLRDRLLDHQSRCRLLMRAAKTVMVDDPDLATQLLVESIDSDDLSHTVEVWARLGYSGVPRKVLAGLTGLTGKPETEGSRPDLDLVRGLLRRSADPMAEEAIILLRRAEAGFEAQGNGAAQVVAGCELGCTHRMRGESQLATEALERAVALADQLGPETDADIRAKAMMARAVLADEAGDHLEVLRCVERLEEEVLPHQYGSATYLLAMLTSLHIGDGPGAIGFAEQFKRSAPPDRSWAPCLPLVAAWHAGQPFDAGQSLDAFEHHHAGNAVDRVWSGSSLALLAVFRNDLGRAEEALDAARVACPASALPRIRSLVASAEACLAVARGEEDRAREVIRAYLASENATTDGAYSHSSIVRAFHWCLAVVYVVCPELRATIDLAPLGPALASKRRAGQIFVAWRENGAGLDDLPDSNHRALVAALPAPWAAAFVAGLAPTVKASALAQATIDIYGDAARTVWRELDDAAAQKLARTLPVDPGTTITISDLGPMDLLIDGVAVTNQNWDRDRVQALLGLLAHHRSISRDEVMLSLWPDLDAEAARRNLRVTLSHLQSLIEPSRSKGDAPFYIRAVADRLLLHETAALSVDSDRFERLIDTAHHVDGEGRVGEVIELLTEAIGLWRGDYLCRFRYEDWSQVSATRLRSRFVEACVRLGEIRLSLDQPMAAIRAVERALETEPWSEPAHVVLITGYLATGNRAGALRAYRNCVEALSELGVRPMSAVVDLIEAQGMGADAHQTSSFITASTA